MAREYHLMSSDGHLAVPPERWSHRVPEKWRDRAPRSIDLPEGGDAIILECRPPLEDTFLRPRPRRAPGHCQPSGLGV